MYTVSERYRENIAKLVTFTGIHGTIALNDGTTAEFGDDNVKQGSLSVSSRMNTAGEFKAGGVFSSELSMTLVNCDSNISLSEASINLEFRLYTDSSFSEYDAVPLGYFRVESAGIKRKKDTVSFKAYDDIRLFSADCEELEGTLYELVSAACTACGVVFGMTQEEFEQLPNSGITAKINTARIQTWSDLLMYVGVVTNSFARISRSNTLVFVQLSCTVSEGGLVIPVREVTGDLRKSTEFSDAAARITKIIMMRNGVRLKSKMEVTSSNAPITLEWADNPLLAEKTDDEVKDILTASLTEIYRCINRPYKSELIAGDPALDIGDYVRLTGGDIDTNRGYATGMITQQLWKYRGIHKIQCSVPASAAESGNTAAAQPKSQLEKRIDALETGGGGDTFNEAIILTQGDLPYILHSYSVIEYRKDYNVIAQGPDSNIIIDGYIAYAQDAISANAVKYTGLTFKGSTSASTAPDLHEVTVKITQSGRENDGTPYNYIVVYDNGTAKGAGTRTYGNFGCAIQFKTILAPNAVFVNGYAQVIMSLIYTTKAGAATVSSTTGFNGFVEFKNPEEYRAAIRLTKEPQAGGEVIETTITDDGNSTLEKAMLYTDKVAENLQNSFDNITAADREQITQNTSDIAAHDVRITALEGEVDDITAPAGGILSQSKNYTDYVADELRGEFGG